MLTVSCRFQTSVLGAQLVHPLVPTAKTQQFLDGGKILTRAIETSKFKVENTANMR